MTELNASAAAEPMSDERLAEIREAARPEHAAILAQLIKHGAHDLPEGKVIVHGCTVVPVADLKAAVKTVWFGMPAVLAEVDRLRAERVRVVDALSDVGRTAEAASSDLECGINAELLAADVTMATAEGAVKRVRDLHRPVAAHAGDPDDDDTLTTACAYCSVPYPCQTIAALDGTEAGR